MKFTGNIIRYDKDQESELIALLESEPDWNAFVRGEALGVGSRVIDYPLGK